MKTLSLNLENWNSLSWRDVLRSKYLWLSLGVILLIGAGIYYAIDYFSANSVEASEAPQVQTSVARNGELTVFATGAGQVIPAIHTEISIVKTHNRTFLMVRLIGFHFCLIQGSQSHSRKQNPIKVKTPADLGEGFGIGLFTVIPQVYGVEPGQLF